MSMARMLNTMRMQAMMARGSFSDPCFGVVSSLDTENYCAKVRLQPDDVETGWLPILSQWVGDGWGLFLPTPVGTQVMVVFSEANPEIGMIVGSVFHDGMRPLDCPEGEAWLQHKSGAFIKLLNNGDVHIKHPSECELHLQEGGKIYGKAPGGFEWEGDTNITGNLTVTADITDQTDGGNVHTVKDMRDAYNQHGHIAVQPGAGVSGITNIPKT